MSKAWAKAWSAAEIGEVWDDFMAANLKPKWIKCSERMPEDGQWVLVWGAFTYGGAALVSVAIYTPAHPTGWHSPDSWLATKSITHWQPLPEPPEGDV